MSAAAAMDDLLDLGEEKRRSSATSVRSYAGGWGPVRRVGQMAGLSEKPGVGTDAGPTARVRIPP